MSTFPTVASLIAHIESGGRADAVRFEPRLYAHTLGLPAVMGRITVANKCSIETARVIYSTSFGLYQIMGFNIYIPHGFNKSIFAFVNDIDAQNDVFNDYLIRKNIAYSVDALRIKANAITFARAYNGSDAYADKILELLK